MCRTCAVLHDASYRTGLRLRRCRPDRCRLTRCRVLELPVQHVRVDALRGHRVRVPHERLCDAQRDAEPGEL